MTANAKKNKGSVSVNTVFGGVGVSVSRPDLSVFVFSI